MEFLSDRINVNISEDKDTGRLLSQFIDILNKYGLESPELSKFRAEHENNLELKELMEAAMRVRVLFDKGLL